MNDDKPIRRTTRSRAKGSEAAADYSHEMEGKEPGRTEKPSQAEGNRETVDQALREHEESGELY